MSTVDDSGGTGRAGGSDRSDRSGGTDRPVRSSVPEYVTSSGGVELRLHELAVGTARVLAAHATGFNGLIWQPLAEALADSHVVAPDFRAHGASPVPEGADLHWDRFADDVLATVDALAWDSGPRPVGVGHSMGGAALLLAELARPGTFAALWVYEPIVFPPEIRELSASVDNPLALGARRRRPTFASLAEAVSTYAAKPPMNSFTTEALTAYVEGGFVDEPDGTVRLACRPEDEARIYDTAATCSAFERLDAVSCPVAVVRGAMAPTSPAQIAVPASQGLARGQLIVHDELSHFGPMEDPAGLAAEIDRFTSQFGDSAS